MSYIISLFWWRYPKVLAYMEQASLYEPMAFWKWCLRVNNFKKVTYRKNLVATRNAKIILALIYGQALTLLSLAVAAFVLGIRSDLPIFIAAGALGVCFYPALLALISGITLALLRQIVMVPKERRLIARARKIFAKHPGIIIAVAGSYGKTSMKELLATVLASGAKVAATPGSKNVAVSHAYFASRLQGDEDFVIVELGEGYKGDIKKMINYVQPKVAVLTGIAPNHLDEYGTLDNLIADFDELVTYCGPANSFVNTDTELAKKHYAKKATSFDHQGVAGWQVSDVKLSVLGTDFNLKKGGTTLNLHTGLIGRHNLAPVALAAAFAVQHGLTKAQVEAAVAQTAPFEHRLEPRPLGGGWIIDDTYNGSIEGMRAGLAFLKELKVPGRKVFVTPGLVDQGDENTSVHNELGKLIADANPDEVVLMKNSVTDDIVSGLEAGKYAGKLNIISRPLEYYENIQLVMAAGDVYLLQNDWPDFYN